MVCIDTGIIIDFLQGKRSLNKYSRICTTSVSIMKLVRGIGLDKVRDDEKEKINELIGCIEVLDFDEKSARKAGEIEANLVKNGEIIDLEDIMISGICISNDEPILTNNLKHFKRVEGLTIL